MRFRRATGLGVLRAREFLTREPRDLWERILEAAEARPTGVYLRDPMESHPEFGPVISRVLEEVRVEAEQAHRVRVAELEETSPAFTVIFRYPRGLCHHIWRDAQERLRKEHGIEWRTPAEMNPGGVFD